MCNCDIEQSKMHIIGVSQNEKECKESWEKVYRRIEKEAAWKTSKHR